MSVVTIVGAGMMGSALAFPARENGHEIRLVGTHLDREIIVHYNLPDDACVSCEWGEFIDTFSCPLYITGVSKGRSWVQIVLYDENEKMLTTKNIYVTVE